MNWKPTLADVDEYIKGELVLLCRYYGYYGDTPLRKSKDVIKFERTFTPYFSLDQLRGRVCIQAMQYVATNVSHLNGEFR